MKNSGSFSSHLDTVGCAPDQQSIRLSATASNAQSHHQSEFRNENCSAANRSTNSHHGSQASNLSGGEGPTDMLLRRQHGSTRDSMGMTSRAHAIGDHRVRSRSRSR